MSENKIGRLDKWKLILYKNLIESSKKHINIIEEKYIKVTNFLTPLSPIIVEDDSIDNYITSLNEAINKENVTNIALAGSYGAGKSSIIKTFISKKKGVLNVLEISLANFKKPASFNKVKTKKKETTEYQKQLDIAGSKGFWRNHTENNDEEEFNKYQKLLELSILQQIIYRVSPKKLPDSRFKRIIGFTRWELFINSLLILLWIYSTFILLQNNYFIKLNPFTWDANRDIDFLSISLGLIFFGGLGAFIYYKGIRIVNNSKITRISLKGEIDIGKNVDESILNKHLDEVLYFFEKNKFDLVVIEDLDRYNDTQIFSKLREINYLINKSSQIKKKVIFLYAVRDDIFEGEDRTKFFDLTIPVIPIVDYSNSKSQLKKRLDSLNGKTKKSKTENKEDSNSDSKERSEDSKKSKKKKTKEISSQFISQISFFINDMRLINNICNEYFMYKESQVEIPDQNKLLALIIYKNLKPDDFDHLQKNEGKLYEIIKKKADFINTKTVNLRKDIENLSEEIDELENLIATNISELQGIYISTLLKICPSNATSILLNNRPVRFTSLYKDSNFDDLLKATNVYYYGIVGSGYESQLSETFSFNKLEEKIESDLKYQERKRLIIEKSENQIEEKKQLISAKKREISLLSTRTIYQILQENSITDYIQNDEELLEEKLIIFLLRNGYIDEHYSNYISRFYDTEVTVDEQKFILNVLNGLNNDIHQPIQNGKYVTQRIPKGFFGKQESLNINLLEYLLSDIKKYQKQLDEVTDLIATESKYSIEFLESFIEKSDKSDVLFSLLTKKWGTIWKFIENYKYDKTQVEKLFILIIENSKLEDLIKIASKSKFESFLQNESLCLEYFASSDSKKIILELIKKMNLKFRDISVFRFSKNMDLQNFIVNKNHYQINIGNIEFILNNYSEREFSKKDLLARNLTCILESNFSPFIDYIKEEIHSYIDNVFLELNNNKEESESTLIFLLDEERLTDIQKEIVITKSNTVINDISEIYDVEAKEILLKNQCLKINWNNVLDYFKANGVDTELNEHLESFLDDVGVTNILKKYSLYTGNLEEESESETFLALAIIYNSHLKSSNYKNLLQSLRKNWVDLELEKIKRENLTVLIDSQTIKLNADYFRQLKEISENLHLYLIEKNWETFSEEFVEYDLEEEDAYYLLQSDIINIAQKKDYIDYLEEEFITSDKDLSLVVMSIFNILQVKGVEYTFIRDLFKHQESPELKIKLLNFNLEQYTQPQLRVLVNSLGGEYSLMVKGYQRPNIPETSENLKLVKGLKSKNVISTFDVNEEMHQIKVNAKRWPTSPNLA